MKTFNPNFLVISLGNTGQYYDTLHSAGHFALLSLQKALVSASIASEELPQPEFSMMKWGLRKCLSSPGIKYTLLQSPMLMNASGRFVANAWKDFLERYEAETKEVNLVIVHDDLEEQFGSVKARMWTASNRGHNGIKSIESYLKTKDYPFARWSRISVGIDRPESRDIEDVSSYVLSRMTSRQKEIIDTKVGSRILECLENLETEWRKDFEREAKQAELASQLPRIIHIRV